VPCVVDKQTSRQADKQHEAQLTRSDVTSSVHYIRFHLTPAQIERFASGPVANAAALPT
jgi:hypothetical protein